MCLMPELRDNSKFYHFLNFEHMLLAPAILILIMLI